MLENIIAKYRDNKIVTSLGDRRYNVQDKDTYRYFGKDNYGPSGSSADALTNGLFTVNADGWDLSAGWVWLNSLIWTFGGLRAGMVQTNANQSSPNEIVIGKTYQVTFTISEYLSGSLRAEVGDTGFGTLRSSNGTFVESILAEGTVNSFWIKGVGAGSDISCKIDTVSCSIIALASQTVSIGAVKDVSILDVFVNLDVNRLGSSLRYTAQSDDETKVIANIIGDNVRLLGIATGSAIITLIARDLFTNSSSITFTTTVS